MIQAMVARPYICGATSGPPRGSWCWNGTALRESYMHNVTAPDGPHDFTNQVQLAAAAGSPDAPQPWDGSYLAADPPGPPGWTSWAWSAVRCLVRRAPFVWLS